MQPVMCKVMAEPTRTIRKVPSPLRCDFEDEAEMAWYCALDRDQVLFH